MAHRRRVRGSTSNVGSYRQHGMGLISVYQEGGEAALKVKQGKKVLKKRVTIGMAARVLDARTQAKANTIL